jgi:hypothetical protein
VRNDLRARGDLNFASDSDFDSAAPGDQTLPDNSGSVIAVSGGDGNDALYADELSATVRLRGQRGNDDFAIGDVVAVLAPSGQLSVDMSVAGMGSLANSATSTARPVGTVLRYRLSEAATVTVHVLPAEGTKFSPA